jgi:hypothetical protein
MTNLTDSSWTIDNLLGHIHTCTLMAWVESSGRLSQLVQWMTVVRMSEVIS